MKRLFYHISLLATVLLTACTSDETTETEQPLPEGKGRISITICAPETVETNTRAVYEEDANNRVHDFPWEAPDHEWEKLKTFRVYICNADMEVVQIISGDESQMSQPSTDMSEHTYRTATVTSQALDEGNYYIFATANFNSGENTNDAYDDGIAEGSTINENVLMKFANSSTYYILGDDTPYQSDMKNIPMTGKLTDEFGLKQVQVSYGYTTPAGTLMLWRVMAKMQFEFTNESEEEIQILGIEVDPINKVSDGNPGIYLFSKDDLTSTANLAPGTGVTLPANTKTDMGTVVFTPVEVDGTAQPLTLAAKNDGDTDQGKIYFYVNESDGTFTTTNNQYSLRFKIKRGGTIEEIRYGVTTHHDLSTSGAYGGTSGGFNVIRRNDWIHIPVVLTDWQLRIEPLAFVPIAGYPATTLSSDGLTATFKTGGMIALQPFVKKYDDPTWRAFGDPDISYGEVVMDSQDNTKEDEAASWTASIHWKNTDGEDISGDGKIVKTAFAYDPITKSIIGELNNSLSAGPYKTTFTVSLRLAGATSGTWYHYTYTFNVILDKSTP